MPVTQAAVRLVALLLALGGTLFIGASNFWVSGSIVAICSAVIALPVTSWFHAVRVLLDWRPAAIEYSTVRAADPRDGHAEFPEDDVIGPILERRILPSARLRQPSPSR